MATSEGGERRAPERWWVALARRLLHPVQVEIIEALWESDVPLDARDLADIVGVKVAIVNHHMRRLRTINAVTYAEDPTLHNSLAIPFRIVRSPDDES
ncbi:MAG: ArsR family transcriptional regulator [Solirubrobacterales bacterium]